MFSNSSYSEPLGVGDVELVGVDGKLFLLDVSLSIVPSFTAGEDVDLSAFDPEDEEASESGNMEQATPLNWLLEVVKPGSESFREESNLK